MVMKEVRDATARIVDSTRLADVLGHTASNLSGKEPSRYTN